MLEKFDIYDCKRKIKIHTPATTAFMTKIKVNTHKTTNTIIITGLKKRYSLEIICSNIKSYK